MSGIAGSCDPNSSRSFSVHESNGTGKDRMPAAKLLAEILDGYDFKIDQLKAGQDRIEEQLAKLAVMIDTLSRHSKIEQPVKEWYTPAEAAEVIGKRPYTVREWCRLCRINARKRSTGRGEVEEWEIPAQEIERYRNHGLLPIPTKY